MAKRIDVQAAVQKLFVHNSKREEKRGGKKSGERDSHSTSTRSTCTTGSASDKKELLSRRKKRNETDHREDDENRGKVTEKTKKKCIKDKKVTSGCDCPHCAHTSPRNNKSRDTSENSDADHLSAIEAEDVPKATVAKADRKRYSRSVELAVADFVKHITKAGVSGLREEFATLQEPALIHEAHASNMERNRYRANLCADATRVVLRLNVPPSTDYIHANWIRAANADTVFIATQGPLETTIEDFWRMCYQERVTTILMLCNVTEKGKPKCAQYWPPAVKTDVRYGMFTVFNREMVKEENVETSSLEVSAETLNNPPMCITHIHLTCWPDAGVLSSGGVLHRLIKRIRKKGRGPCVVHCAAGAGRTGTTITIAIISSRLFKGSNVKLQEVVNELRWMRAHFVMKEKQYLFVAAMVLGYIWMRMRGEYNKEIRGFWAEVNGRLYSNER